MNNLKCLKDFIELSLELRNILSGNSASLSDKLKHTNHLVSLMARYELDLLKQDHFKFVILPEECPPLVLLDVPPKPVMYNIIVEVSMHTIIAHIIEDKPLYVHKDVEPVLFSKMKFKD